MCSVITLKLESQVCVLTKRVVKGVPWASNNITVTAKAVAQLEKSGDGKPGLRRRESSCPGVLGLSQDRSDSLTKHHRNYAEAGYSHYPCGGWICHVESEDVNAGLEFEVGRAIPVEIEGLREGIARPDAKKTLWFGKVNIDHRAAGRVCGQKQGGCDGEAVPHRPTSLTR